VLIHCGALVRQLTAYRLDDQQRWSEETLELFLVDERWEDWPPDFEYQFLSPADRVLLVVLWTIEKELA
jgi:hypothetical protein